MLWVTLTNQEWESRQQVLKVANHRYVVKYIPLFLDNPYQVNPVAY